MGRRNPACNGTLETETGIVGVVALPIIWQHAQGQPHVPSTLSKFETIALPPSAPLRVAMALPFAPRAAPNSNKKTPSRHRLPTPHRLASCPADIHITACRNGAPTRPKLVLSLLWISVFPSVPTWKQQIIVAAPTIRDILFSQEQLVSDLFFALTSLSAVSSGINSKSDGFLSAVDDSKLHSTQPESTNHIVCLGFSCVG